MRYFEIKDLGISFRTPKGKMMCKSLIGFIFGLVKYAYNGSALCFFIRLIYCYFFLKEIWTL